MNDRARNDTVVYHPPWSLHAWIGAFWTLLIVAIMGWLLSLAIEWAGMAFKWWALPGAQHSEQLLQTELYWLSRDFTLADANARVVEWADWGRMTLYQWSGVRALFEWTIDTQPTFWKPLEHLRALLLVSGEYLLATAYITQLVGARLAVIVLSLPAFVLAGVMGIIDGLVQRDLRRFGGGAESGFLYHHLKSFLRPMVWAPIVIYLAVPWSLHPTLVFVPPALLFGYLLQKTMARFKKYL